MPDRSLPVFLDTLKVIVPLPVPVPPVSTVIQEALDVEIHAQPPDVVTDTGLLVAAFLPKL